VIFSLEILAVCSFFLWILSLWLRDASIADLMWGLYFVILSWISYTYNPTHRGLLISVLTSIWGFRLALYLFLRNHKKAEDRRYAAMRKYHGQHFWWRSFFTIFILQMLLAWLIGFPQQFAHTTTSFHYLDLIGLSLWCIGLYWEVVGDWQLYSFLQHKKEHDVLDTGLWRYSRHPNYFGDALLWWGYGCIGFAGTGWWLIWLCPACMNFLLLYVSGVRMLETNIGERRPQYKEYIQNTSAFLPWFPKNEAINSKQI
jgi:steroid 5-alpha reductase family enzyme